MELVKETTISVMTTDGKKIERGDTVAFNLEDRCCTGVFMGIGKKGALMFDSKIVGTGVRFHIMPRSIKEIYRAEVKVDMGFMNPPAEKEREE